MLHKCLSNVIQCDICDECWRWTTETCMVWIRTLATRSTLMPCIGQQYALKHSRWEIILPFHAWEINNVCIFMPEACMHVKAKESNPSLCCKACACGIHSLSSCSCRLIRAKKHCSRSQGRKVLSFPKRGNGRTDEQHVCKPEMCNWFCLVGTSMFWNLLL